MESSPHLSALEHSAFEQRAEFILKRSGLTWQELAGKTILDVGAGRADFAQAAQARGIHVVSVDLHPYTDEAIENALRQSVNIYDSRRDAEWVRFRDDAEKVGGGKPVPYVWGTAHRLPFAGDTFDVVLTHAGPPVVWADSLNERANVIKEMKRVLRPGGILRISPARTRVLEKDFPELEKHVESGPNEISYYHYQK